VITARIGGAVARVPADVIVNMWTSGQDPEPHLEWGRGLAAAMKPFATGGVYVDALADEPLDRVRAAYGRDWERLVEVKRRYDPENVFRLNANVRP